MLLIVFKYLMAFGWKIPAAFSYFSTRMFLSAATSLLMTIFLGPRVIKKLYEWKIGQPIRSVEEVPLLAELHGKKKDTPTMGGILILFTMAVSLFLWMDLANVFTWILLFTTIVLGYLGGMDDYLKLRYKNSKGLSGKKKMLIQVGFSALIAGYLLIPSVSNAIGKAPIAKEQALEGKRTVAETISVSQYTKRLYIPFFKEPVLELPAIIAALFIIFVITGSSNAVNLTDGLDGLAAGCLVMVSIVLAAFAFVSNHFYLAKYLNILYIEGSGEIAVYLFAMAGAALGFLWYNGYPAQVFMGDVGSLSLGGVLGVSSVLLKREVILAIAGIIFVVEALSVILQVLSYRYRNKKRVFLCAPLHHHFEYKGWPETKVVIRFWIISLLFAIIAVASLKLQ
jgi:phospho-N-acetylmuramoyl-pentapeptide-transferase